MGVLENSMKVVKLATTLANPELYQAATKANVEALELSNKNIELQRKIGELESQVSNLEAKLKLTGGVFRAPENTSVVFLEGDPIGCCSHCWDADRELIHIVRMNNPNHPGLGCPHCKTMLINRSVENPRMKVVTGGAA